MALALMEAEVEAPGRERNTMERHETVGEKVRRTLSDLMDMVKGQGLRKTAALQPVPVRVPVPFPIDVRRAR
jgi:hypothetical protein